MTILSFFVLLAVALCALAQPPRPPRRHHQTTQTTFYQGHDLSSLGTLESVGAIYKDTTQNNATRPAEDILADGGMNAVRLRLWVDPVGGTNGQAYTIALAQRFQSEGHAIYLDFHFADSWADPTKQPTPASWPTPDQGVTALASTLRDYVCSTLDAFHDAGVSLDIVSLGNEIRNGLLWPLGYVDLSLEGEALAKNFTNLATLYQAARAGVNDAVNKGVPKPQVMIHIDDGWDISLQEQWFGALTGAGVPTNAWDVFGFSFYPFYGTNATFDNLKTTLNTLAGQYNKPLHVAETDYPAICNGEYNPIPPSSEPQIPYSIQGQITWTQGVVDAVKSVPGGLGQGVWYWEPAWLNNTSLGSDCNDAILFQGDFSEWPTMIGYSRPSVDLF